uniref:Candidate secreted effector n=1 Tax=Meloidogyne incognita TaxID=6306 RepID=A0A914MGM5_MELIC
MMMVLISPFSTIVKSRLLFLQVLWGFEARICGSNQGPPPFPREFPFSKLEILKVDNVVF